MTLSTISKQQAQAGFTLIELMMVIILIGVLSAVTVDVISDTANDSKFQETMRRMKQIQNAMIGDPDIRTANGRTNFGFLGDIGAIPTAGQGIAALVTKPAALTAFAIDATVRFGYGWNGPYLSSSASGTVYTQDGWGNNFVYTPGASPPTIVSYGADGAAGGTGYNQDITFNLPTELRTATVTGFICTSGGPFAAAAQVEMNYPTAGALTQSLSTLVAANKGQFSFATVPLGIRSITVYIPSKAAPTTTLGPVIITVDTPNIVVPCSQIDTNP